MSAAPHPLISLSIITVSLSTFWYTFYSPYTLRKVRIVNSDETKNENETDSHTSDSYCWCISKQLNVFPQHWQDKNKELKSSSTIGTDKNNQQHEYARNNWYLVEHLAVNKKDPNTNTNTNTKKQPAVERTFRIQQCFATSGDFIESNRNYARKKAAKSMDPEARERAFAWEWRSDYDHLCIDEHRMLMWSEELEHEFLDAKQVSKTKRKAFERDLLIDKTINIVSKNDHFRDEKIGRMKNVDDEVFDSPLLIKESHLTWKSQIHEEPKWLVTFLPHFTWKEFDGREFVRGKYNPVALEEIKERITVKTW